MKLLTECSRVAHRTLISALCLLACLCLPLSQRADAATDGDAGGNATSLTTRQAGARYGQAAGVALVCYWLKATQRVDELRIKYRDVAAAEFDSEAEKIAQSWTVPAICKNAGGPNACRLSIMWSCQQAIKEIGPEGTVVPGLVEPRQQAR